MNTNNEDVLPSNNETISPVVGARRTISILNRQIDTSDEAGQMIANMKNIFPFLILFILRFMSIYFLRVFYFAVIYFFTNRFISEFAERIALQNNSVRSALALLFVASFLFMSICIHSNVLFHENIVHRIFMYPYHHAKDMDVIEAMWISALTDTIFRLGFMCIKNIFHIFSLLNINFRFFVTSGIRCLPDSLRQYLNRASYDPFSIRNIFGSPSVVGASPNNSVANDIESGEVIEDASRISPRNGESVINRRRHSRDSPTSSLLDGIDDVGSLNGNKGGGSVAGGHATATIDSDDDDEKRTLEITKYIFIKKVFSLADIIAYSYRYLLPIPIWVQYFQYGSLAKLLIFIYMGTKLSYFALNIYPGLSDNISRFFSGKMDFGSYASTEDVASSGSSECAICFDSFYKPVKIPCGHVFCEHCIVKWIDTENTCPVCRATVISTHANEIKELSTSILPIIM